MATRWGHAVYEWLLERGWLPASPLPPDVCGDRGVVDPRTGDEHTVYAAAELHRERTNDYPDCLKENA